MSVLFGIEIWKPGPSERFLQLEKEFKEFKKKEEREDPIQEQKIEDIKRSLNKVDDAVETVSDMSMANVKDLKGRIKKQKERLEKQIARTDNIISTTNITPLKVAVKGHTQKLEEIENKLKKDNIKEAMKAAVTKQQLEEAMKAAATKQQQEIQAFKEEMKKQYQMISYQLQYKNAKINAKGNSILDARRKVLNPSGGKKKKKNNN